MVIERYSHVMHIVSNVEGRLQRGAGRARRAAREPSRPARCRGAPKVRAMEIIDELEPAKRGIYAGAVGYLGFHGDMDLAIAHPHRAWSRTACCYVQAGAGIVADSDPAAEWQETQNKARAVLRAAEMASAGLDTRLEELIMLLMIDNYDSFTYNLVQYFGELGEEVRVVRNDAIDLDGIAALAPARIVISPGPCTPSEAGISRAADPRVRRQDPDPRRLPRPPGDRPGLRRPHRARADG